MKVGDWITVKYDAGTHGGTLTGIVDSASDGVLCLKYGDGFTDIDFADVVSINPVEKYSVKTTAGSPRKVYGGGR